ncbi:xanthine dehydrogenase family protein subunit M [Streptomyces sp. VNUA116]|uniref:xanthine dehydrogenase family protein subunit M n=1 Tax=Streptomyces sp. VNUA116 TaxID=3062449 RepID=UPI0034A06069
MSRPAAMDFLLPDRLDEALHAMAARAGTVPVAGGTDVMVRLARGLERPPAAVDLTRIPGLARWERSAGRVRIGATVPYTRIAGELAGPLPGLAAAARTVGSRQIRNRGTVGGALGTASAGGDVHPVLLACDAEVELVSARGNRRVPVREFYTGPGRTVRAPDELVRAVLVPEAEGPQSYAKAGRRGALVVATCSFAVALWPSRGRVGTGIGAAADRPLPACEAERFVAGELAERRLWRSRGPLPDSVLTRFGELAAAAASPADDVRGSSAYRRHAVAVLARRALGWVWDDYRADRTAKEAACA